MNKKYLAILLLIALIAIPNILAIPWAPLIIGAVVVGTGIYYAANAGYDCTASIEKWYVENTTTPNVFKLHLIYTFKCKEPYGCIGGACTKVPMCSESWWDRIGSSCCRGYYFELVANAPIFYVEGSKTNKIKYGPLNGDLSKVGAYKTDKTVFYKFVPGAVYEREMVLPLYISKEGTYTINAQLKLEIKTGILWPFGGNPVVAEIPITITVQKLKAQQQQNVTPKPGACEGKIQSITPTKDTFTTDEYPSVEIRYTINCPKDSAHYIILQVDNKKYRYGEAGVTDNINDKSYIFPGTTAFFVRVLAVPELLKAGSHSITAYLYSYPSNTQLDSKSTTITVKQVTPQPRPVPRPIDTECKDLGGLQLLYVKWNPSRVYAGETTYLILGFKNLYSCYYKRQIQIYIDYKSNPAAKPTTIDVLTANLYVKGKSTAEVKVKYVPPSAGIYKPRILIDNKLYESTVALFAVAKQNQTPPTPTTGCRLDITKVEVPEKLSVNEEIPVKVYWSLACPEAPSGARGFFLKIYLYKGDKLVSYWKWSPEQGLVYDTGLAGDTVNVYISWDYLTQHTSASILLPPVKEGGFYAVKVCPVLNVINGGDTEDADYGSCATAKFEVEGGEQPGVPIKIVKIGLYNETGGEISAIALGQKFYVCADIKAVTDASGKFKMELKADQPLWTDPVLASNTWNVMLRKGETKRYCLEYTAKQDVIFAQTKYHVDVYWNDKKLMRYPENPSQDWQVIVPKAGQDIVVEDHGWKSKDGTPIDSTWDYEAVVYAIVKNRANVPAPLTITFVIKEDVPLLPDTVYIKKEITDVLPAGAKKEYDVEITFDHDGSFHYEIYINGKKVVDRGKSLSVGFVGWLTKLTNGATGKMLPYTILAIGIIALIMILMWYLQPMLLIFLYRQMLMMELLRKLMGKE